MLPDKDLIFHSALRDACKAQDGGRLLVRFTGRRSRVIETRNRVVAPFRLEGEDRERRYQVESDDVRRAIERLPIDVPLLVQASGGKGRHRVEIFTPDGAPFDPDAVGVPAPEGNGRRRHEDDRGAIAKEAWEALLIAHKLVERYAKITGHLPPAAVTDEARQLFHERNMSRGRPWGRVPAAEDLQPLTPYLGCT